MLSNRSLAIALALLCAFGKATRAQFLDAAGTIRPGAAGHYDLRLTDTGTATIGTFWYAQFAGLDYLGSAPTAVESPPGWSSIITHNPNRADGFGIQWTAASPAARLSAGSSLTGFGFDTADPRDQIVGHSPVFTNVNTGTSVVNSAGPDSDFGAQIDIAPVSIPGDANIDGKVDFSDLLILAQNFGAPGDFRQGNFNGDFFVTFADLLILAQNFGTSDPTIQAQQPGRGAAPVPEPSTWVGGLMLLGMFLRPSRSRSRRSDVPRIVRLAIRRGVGFLPPRSVYEAVAGPVPVHISRYTPARG